MYNTDKPTREELPTSAQLKRSTLIAALSAVAILVTIVLPSEYGIDPTRVGRLLGLTDMGQIKTQLAAEAAADAAMDANAAAGAAGQKAVLVRLDRIETLLTNGGTAQTSKTSGASGATAAPVSPAPASPASAPAVAAATTPPASAAQPAPVARKVAGRSDEMTIQLAPNQGVEVKLVMKEGAQAQFSWSAKGGPVNFDTHGDAKGKSISYEKGRGVNSDEGMLEAAFDGNHGWFWRNRNGAPVTVTLRTNGDYAEIRRVL
ncbi:transmembrane anchor protein [Achromobacter animicus]|uniref:transmembrane anchor protein n=1 Tax=Achromobacter animicus TaxID=1389935 RepID=UPI00244D6BC6|nr:transmembrane anchor protein [Achromobacter animicus]MDH0682748.1 transmembrane anchor protein [Achromobacter animicus]